MFTLKIAQDPVEPLADNDVPDQNSRMHRRSRAFVDHTHYKTVFSRDTFGYNAFTFTGQNWHIEEISSFPVPRCAKNFT